MSTAQADHPPEELTDAELRGRWCALEPCDDGTCPEHDAVAAELERRGMDF